MPIPHYGLDLLTEIAGAQDHARNALATQIIELAANNWPPRDLDQGLGDFFGNGTQTGG